MFIAKKWFVCAIACLSIYSFLVPVARGSKTAVSVESFASFPAADADNQMLGFGWFKNGFMLENSSTSCVFESVYPVSGNVILNGGTLNLKQDLVLHLPLHFEVGRIVGNFFAIDFPRGLPTLSFPQKRFIHRLNSSGSVSIGGDIYSIDWSFDDKYIAVSTKGRGGAELLIYRVDNGQIQLVTSFESGGVDINCVRWHPSEYRLAAGFAGGTSALHVWNFDTTTNTLTSIGATGITSIAAVAWNPAGTYLAVADSTAYSISLYGVGSSSISLTTNLPLGALVIVQKNALSWDPTGTYLAVGLARIAAGRELRVLSFNGSTLQAFGEITVGADVNAVAWRPRVEASPVLAVGSAVTNEQFSIYSLDTSNGTLTRSVTAQSGSVKTVNSVSWHMAGDHTAMGTIRDTAGAEMRIFGFDDVRGTLRPDSTQEYNVDVINVAYSRSGGRIAVAGADKIMYLLDVSPQWLETSVALENVSLFFNSSITFQSIATFDGVCTVNGCGHTLDFDENARVIVGRNSTLVLEDMRIRGLSGNKIQCVDDSSTVVLRDITWVQDSDTTFTVGSLQIDNKVRMEGEFGTVFSYRSNNAFSILSRSRLEIDAGITFSYDPISLADNLISFAGSRSELSLHGATWCSAVPRLAMTTGQFEVHGDCSIMIPRDGEIIFGDGTTSSDCLCEIFGGSVLRVFGGLLRYKNQLPASWRMADERSRMRMMLGSTLLLEESMNLGNGMLVFEGGTRLVRKQGKDIIGAIHSLGAFTTAAV